MSATPLQPLNRLAILALTGATALSLAACSRGNNTPVDVHSEKPTTSASPTTAAAKPPPPPPMGKDEVEGLVRSVSGNTIQLTQRDRTAATVDLTPATMITELSPAQLTDVTAGSCIDVAAGPGTVPPGGATTARSVTIDPLIGGQCPPLTPPSGAPAASPGAHGTVTSVTGNTIAITSTDPTGKTTRANVTVTDATSYTKHAVTGPQAIQNGKCMAARGTKGDGVLQATTIDLEPCPPMGRPHHHRFHIPHHLHRR